MSGYASPYSTATPDNAPVQIGGGMSGGLISRVSTWAAMPLTSQMSVGTVALGLVLAICACIIWTRILRNVVKDVVRDI